MSVDIDIKIDEKIKIGIDEPSLYKVIMLNDNTTPIEWVVDILTKIFHHSQETAEKITLQIHNEGAEVVGLYTYEIAEQKIVETTSASRERGFPLQLKLEQE
jgi:ATP-dependent Clp protease adaptor protein ClpS